MSKPKLSPAQQEVVDLLRRGNVINKHRFDGGWYMLNGPDGPQPVNKNTFRALERKNVVKFIRTSKFEGEYVLSEEWK